MIEGFENRIRQADQGKEIFKRIFRHDELGLDDTFLLVLTDNEECIFYGTKYLPDFIELYHKRKVYVLLENETYADLFSKSGGIVKICKSMELQRLAAYFNVVVRKEFLDTRIIFLTEKNGYNLYIEELLENKEFSLEEYVAISLYQLRGLKEGEEFGSKRYNSSKD